MADAAVQEYAPNENYQNVMDELNLSADGLGLKRWSYGDAWDTGYSAGEKVDSAVANFNPADLFGGGNIPKADDYTNSFDSSSVPSNIADIAKNTKDSVDISAEDLKYMRDAAEQETINRFTTAEIKVDMPVNATVSSNMDLDGVVAYLGDGVNEAMEKAAEGVHS
jgi:hypothetical protein